MRTGIAGAARASDHADRVCGEPLWSKIAMVRFLEYLVMLKRDVDRHALFTSEDFRDWAYEHALPDPPDARAFGNITRIVQRKGLIVTTGRYVTSKNPQTHGREVKVWMVA